MKQRRPGGLFAAAIFLLCAAMTATYLIAGYGAYLDSDMASELALASHLAKEGTLISPTWVYSTEVRVLSTQLIFTPLMALFPHNWRLVRTLGCLILQGILAESAYFCGRSLNAEKRYALLFAGLSISVCSVVYAQMVTIGAYYVPHAVLTNLCVGMTARLMRMRKGGRRTALFALLMAMCALMGASSIRYPFCATIPVAAAGLWAYLFPSGEENAPRTRGQAGRTMLTLAVCAEEAPCGAAAAEVLAAAGSPATPDTYEEDVRAETDMNIVMTGTGSFVEVQGTAEGAAFSRAELDALLALGEKGCADLTRLQQEALGS